MGALSGVLSSANWYGSSGQPFTKEISAEMNASRTRPFTTFISSSQLSLGSGNINPVMMLWVYDSNLYPTAHLAARNGIAIECANANDSWSFISTQILSEAPGPPVLNARANDSYCSLLSDRQEAAMRSFSVSNSALAARSFASPAALTASPSLAFDRLRSSVWIRLFHIPKPTSPTIPMAIAASVMAEYAKNELYGGAAQAITSSAITETTTNAPHQIAHRSHDDDALSNWFSVAFIVPFGRHHAGKNNFRTFLIAVAVWSLMFTCLFTVGFLVK